MTIEEMWYGLLSCPKITRQEIERILVVCKEVPALYGNGRKKVLEELMRPSDLFSGRAAINQEKAAILCKSIDEKKIREEMDDLTRRGIRFVSVDSPDYPARFRILPDLPFGIFVKGNLPSEEEKTCGMVGARACSEYGRAMSVKFAKCLTKQNVQIISGMALGIDAVCSKAALDAGGKTFVILGSGVDVIYPKENISLYYEILMQGGGIISEYLPGTAPLAWQFPHRNRLIAALSDILLVMEARKRSGTLTTVGHALNLGKDVFALPGRVTDPLSESCNLLIRDGAGLLTTPEELLANIGIEERNTGPMKNKSFSDTVTERLYQALDMEPLSLEEICKKADLNPQEAAGKIAFLTLSGWAKEVSPGYYVAAGKYF